MKTLHIDFISDVACPWCVVGLLSLEKALLAFPDLTPEFHLHPYELEPEVGEQGENLLELIVEKYDASPDDVLSGLSQIARRGAELGFTYNFTDESKVWNTFDAHRFIHWAGIYGKALDAKKALFKAYFTDNKNPGDHGLLARLAADLGLDAHEAKEMLASGKFTEEVRNEIALWKERGVNAVPTIRLQNRMTVTSAQTVSSYEQSIRAVLEGSFGKGTPLM